MRSAAVRSGKSSQTIAGDLPRVYVPNLRSGDVYVIDPAQTRMHIAQSLEYLSTKRELRPPKKHGLIPS